MPCSPTADAGSSMCGRRRARQVPPRQTDGFEDNTDSCATSSARRHPDPRSRPAGPAADDGLRTRAGRREVLLTASSTADRAHVRRTRRHRPAPGGAEGRPRSRLGPRRRREDRRRWLRGRDRAAPATATAVVIDASGQAVIPGLHNCHLHSGLLRGTAESMALWEWLENHVDPRAPALTPEIAEAASWMAYTEACAAARSPCWTCGGTWRARPAPPRTSASGQRWRRTPPTATTISRPWRRTGGCWRRTSPRQVDECGRGSAWSTSSTAHPPCSERPPRSPRSSAPGSTHSSESIWEVQECLRQFGRRPIEEFYNAASSGRRRSSPTACGSMIARSS